MQPHTSASVSQAMHKSIGARRSVVALVLATAAMSTGLVSLCLTEGYLHLGLPRLRVIEAAVGPAFATFLFSALSVPCAVAAFVVARSARKVLVSTSPSSMTSTTSSSTARAAQVVALLSLLPALFAPGAAAFLYTLLWLG